MYPSIYIVIIEALLRVYTVPPEYIFENPWLQYMHFCILLIIIIKKSDSCIANKFQII